MREHIIKINGDAMYFDEVKKNFGFGCMRFPMLENGKDVAAEFEIISSTMFVNDETSNI